MSGQTWRNAEQLLAEWDLIVEVRSFRLDVPTGLAWTVALAQALDEWGFVLGDGGLLSARRWLRDEHGTLLGPDTFELEALGTYRFLEPGDIVWSPPLPQLECPFLRAPFGYLVVKVGWDATRNGVEQLVTALIKESMGRVLARDRESGALIDAPCTARKKFSLLLGKYSIDDGDVLLSRDDPDYLRYVIDEVKKALAREGYAAHLGAISTCHNPFRYWAEEDRFHIFGPNGSRPTQKALEAYLIRHEFEIWVFDFDQVGRLANSLEASVVWT